MKFKFAIIGIIAVLIAMFVQNTLEHGFEPLKLAVIIVIAAFLFWIDYKLERPVTRTSMKNNLRGRSNK